MRNARGRRWVCLLLAACVYVQGLSGAFWGPSSAVANVNPLTAITRQVQKANMLVVLDTSGSMTGVPGGGFGAASEVGVDCEDGVDCRPVMMTGACQATPTKLCSNDADCHEGTCQEGADPCMVDADCPFTSGTCSATGVPCQYSSDCSPTPGTCSISGQPCSSAVPCPGNTGTCSKDNSACFIATGCSPAKYCSNNNAMTCAVDTDCSGGGGSGMTSGLVANWSFWEGSGTTTLGYPGAVGVTLETNLAGANGTPWWNTASCGNRKCVTFLYQQDGVISSPPAGFNVTSGFSISAWVQRTNSHPAGTVNPIFTREKGTTGTQLYGLFFNSDSFAASTGSCSVQDPGSVTLNTWYHVAVTYDGSVLNLYRNGTQVATAGCANVLAADTTPIYFGNQRINGTLNNTGADANLSDLRFYNRALSATEVSLMNDPQLAGWWTFEEASGVALDMSGNGNDAAMGGAATRGPGANSNGLYLDGASWASIPAALGGPLDLVGTDYTIALWANRGRVLGGPGPANGATDGEQVLNRQLDGMWNEQYSFGFDTSDHASINWGTPSSGTFESLNTVSSNYWQQYFMVRSGSNFTLYRGPNVVATGTGSPNVGSSQPIILGAQQDAMLPTSPFAGTIDDVMIFRRALSLPEISTLTSTATCVTNTCNPAAETCSAGVNVCQNAVSSNKCVGANNTDKCVISAAAVGPAKMCRVEQKLCAMDSQCTLPNDSCGPATSRAAVAKRVLKSVMARNYDLVNFGMMTFTTGGYFPYYPAQTTSTITDTKYLMREQLEVYGCFDPVTGPTATCTVGPTSYVLRIGKNSRYAVNLGPGGYLNVDQSWCNETCQLAANQGTGIYQGSYYDYTVTVGTYDFYAKPTVLPTYQGRVTNIGGTPYAYFKPRTDYYWNSQNGSNRPPLKGPVDCNNGCSQSCGGSWDASFEPGMDTSDNSAAARSSMMSMLPLLEPAENGGLMSWERTPTGCTLYNKNDTPDVSKRIAVGQEKYYSAYHYLQDAMSKDPKSGTGCRRNSVLLITDGMANGPGDVNNWGATLCDAPACSAADPAAAGCQCAAVLAAQKLWNDLKVTTYVVGFGADVSKSVPRTINNNIARAGHTNAAFLAQNELELQDAVQAALFDSVAGSYETSPATASSGQQGTNGIVSGTLALDARVDFPKWQGHLLAYDISTPTPTLSWDAGNFFTDTALSNAGAPSYWRRRRVWTSDGANMIQVQVDPNTGAILNKSTLRSLGLGATDSEAELIARWMLGDPALKNRHPLGAFVNSTPIDVSTPGNSPNPGGAAFYAKYKDRPPLTYVGSDDGMLHAFFTKATTISGVTYAAGSEAFAFIPPDMLKTITRLYAQGGQRADPNQHVFGLASSPKVKNVCTANCTSDTNAVWKTILVMDEGPGGNNAFMLDVTAPTDAAGIASPPVKMMWHTDTISPGATTSYDLALGQTFSVPGFYYGKNSSYDDQRIVFGSGYPVSTGATNQGRVLVNAQAYSGTILDTDLVTPPVDCGRPYALLTDVATSKNYFVNEAGQLLAAYFGDTFGNLWRYVPNVGGGNTTLTNGDVAQVTQLSCNHPLHFSPTVVQLDRDDPANHPREIYLVQVTNSALDRTTDYPAFPPSKLVIRKDVASASGTVAADMTWGDPTTPGAKVFTAGGAGLCGDLAGGVCNSPLPPDARPASTPSAILKADGTGFQIFALWYQPAPDGCSKGVTYFTLHEIQVSGSIVQKAGFKIASEPVTSTILVGGRLFYIDSQKGAVDLTAQINQKFTQGGAISSATKNGGLRFQMTGWQELP